MSSLKLILKEQDCIILKLRKNSGVKYIDKLFPAMGKSTMVENQTCSK